MPNVICGSPGRVLALVRDGTVKLDNVKYFILDECDKMLEQLGMRLCNEIRALATLYFLRYAP